MSVSRLPFKPMLIFLFVHREEHAAEDAEALVKPPFSFTDLTFKVSPHSTL